jgi:MoxR-like ATPase
MYFSINRWDLIEKILAFEHIRTLYLFGPPGVGKTFSAYHYGRVGKGFYAVTLTDETSAAELRGHFIFKGGDAIWHDGPFVRAMREGKRLVINEITNASSDVLALLFPILESFETACLTLPSGETVKPANGFHVVATDNRAPELLPEALQDRFMAYVEVTETHPKALEALSKDLQKVAAQTIGDGDRLISARGWHSLDILRKEFGLNDACGLAFGLQRGDTIKDALVLALEENEDAE